MDYKSFSVENIECLVILKVLLGTAEHMIKYKTSSVSSRNF